MPKLTLLKSRTLANGEVLEMYHVTSAAARWANHLPVWRLVWLDPADKVGKARKPIMLDCHDYSTEQAADRRYARSK